MDFFQVIDSETLQPQGFMRSAIELVLVVAISCILCRYVQVGAARLSKNVAGGSKIKASATSKGGFGAPPSGDLDDEGLSLKSKDIRSPAVDKEKEVSKAFVVPKPSAPPATSVHQRKPQVDDIPTSASGSTANPPSVASTAAPSRMASIDSLNAKNTSITTPATTTEVKKPLPETSEASHNHAHVHLNKPHGTVPNKSAAPPATADNLLDNTLDELFDDEDMLEDALLAATDGSAKEKEVAKETKKEYKTKGGLPTNQPASVSQPQSASNNKSSIPASTTATPAASSNNRTTTPAAQPAKADDEEDGMFAEMKRKKLAKQKAQQEQATANAATTAKKEEVPVPVSKAEKSQADTAKATVAPKANQSTPAQTKAEALPSSADLLDNTLDEVFDDEALLEEALTDATSA